VVDYITDGRQAVLDDLRTWLIENYPTATTFNRRDVRFVSNKNRRKLLAKKVSIYSGRCRIPIKWRRMFADRLKIHEASITEATNLILACIEKELQENGQVAIHGIGDLRIIDTDCNGRVKPYPVFRADPGWMHDINEPTDPDDLGFNRKIVSGRRLERRVPL
jgi:hypothetical protein